ncbi:hypothetical protein [Marispirochaeta sp.]|uniref:hypothetical protein n=1 Tax=Marispirochaeta sp. TaxID=2038653 RepID=UPI0029C787C9|nr:hypothetical protein [Marispirochaeta sp.]
MTTSLDPDILAVAQWLQETKQTVPFGSLGATMTLHAGKVTKVEKSISETVKTTPENRGNYATIHNHR